MTTLAEISPLSTLDFLTISAIVVLAVFLVAAVHSVAMWRAALVALLIVGVVVAMVGVKPGVQHQSAR